MEQPSSDEKIFKGCYGAGLLKALSLVHSAALIAPSTPSRRSQFARSASSAVFARRAESAGAPAAGGARAAPAGALFRPAGGGEESPPPGCRRDPPCSTRPPSLVS